MKNFVQNGDVLALIAPAAVASGDIVVVGSIIAVAATDAAIGHEVECALTGVFDLPKPTDLAITAGAKVYWDAAGKKATTAAADNMPLGAAVAASAMTAASIRVRLNGNHF